MLLARFLHNTTSLIFSQFAGTIQLVRDFSPLYVMFLPRNLLDPVCFSIAGQSHQYPHFVLKSRM